MHHLLEELKFNSEETFILGLLCSAFSWGQRFSVTGSDVSTMNWHKLFETAVKWNIAPLLYRLIRDEAMFSDKTHIPDPVLKSMEAAYIKTYMVTHSNFSQLTDIVTSLSEENIPVLLLKGAHLARFVYQDIGVRWMSDIDILVRKGDLEKAHGHLAKLGYEYSDVSPVVWGDFGERKQVRDRAAALDWYRTKHMHLRYCNPKAIKSLELHWGIAKSASPFAIDTEGLWERARPETWNGQRVWVLSPEDLLLHIALHDAYYHHLSVFGLRPLCDMAAVIHRFSCQIDWDQLHKRACKWGIEKYVCLMLRLSRELIGMGFPARIFGIHGNEAVPDRIMGQSARRILAKEKTTPRFKGMKYPSKIHVFRPSESQLQKIAFFLKRIPISREELAARYGMPSSASKGLWIYCFLRLPSLIFSYAQVYGPYSWYWLRQGRDHKQDFALDLWLTSLNRKER